ncbi:MAG: strawberry notch family protein [Clostridia bacterium]|nr:strawberry notch family protein [Clostridia bacterium]
MGALLDEWKKKKRDKTEGSGSLLEEWRTGKKYGSVDTSGVNDAYFESYNQAANSFFSDKELQENSYDRWQGLTKQADTIRAWAWQNRDKLGSNYDAIMSATDLSEAGQYWNQFKTAEDYAKEYGSYASYNEMMNADLGALEQEIADWEGRISDLEASTKIGYYAGQGRGLGEILEAMSYGKDQLSSAEQQLAAKRAYYNEAKNIQAGKAYDEQARLDPEFANISANGAVIAPNGRRIENWVAYYRDPQNYDKTPSFSTGHYMDNDQIDSLESIAGRHMEEDEFATYNYLLGKGDKKAAAAYLKSLEYQLNQREASSIAANLKGRPIAEVAWAIPTGLDQFGSGINSAISSIAGNDGYITPSSIQMSSGMVREDLSNYGFKVFGSSVGQIAYDTLNTTANMAPSILAATAVNMVAPGAGAYVGAGLMGLSAGGNAYAEALNNGYSKDNARAYGLFVGASEAALQSVLGGISSMSGAANLSEEVLIGKANAINNALLRVAAKYGIKIGSETVEEELQNFLEPLFRTIFLGEEYDLPTIEELVHTALVTALSTGALESGGIISSDVGTNKYYKDTYGGSQSELVAEGLELDPQSRYFQRLNEKLHQGKDLTGNEIRNVVTRNDRAIRNLGEAEVTVEQAETEAKQIAPETAQNAPKIAQERTEVAAEQTVAKTENKADAESATAEATPTKENVQEQLAQASKDYGKQAKAMVANYIEGQDVAEYSAAFRIAYDMGASGVKLSYVEGMDSYLTASQRKIAYEAGKASQDMRAKTIDKNNQKAASGGTVRKKGAVRGDGVSIDDLTKRFNDTQRSAYSIMSTIAEVTGIDIVLYKSEADAKGNFTDAQGKYKKSEPGTLYIDINAGLNNIKSAGDLANYTMLRTFSHEFVHFIENYNPVWYNELRRVVFDHIENADELIAREAAESGLPYERASREVIAEALTDILPDTSFIEDLANNHKNIFEKLLEKLKEFAASIKAHFAALTPNTNKAAQVLKASGSYAEDIVKAFDKAVIGAVEAYQMTVAEVVAASESTTGGITTENSTVEKKEKTKVEKSLYDRYSDVQKKYPNSVVFYRVGDFYEVLGENAKAVAQWSDLMLSGRNDQSVGRVDMVGFPFHRLDKYVETVRAHKSVTVAMEDGSVTEYPMASVAEPTKAPAKDTAAPIQESEKEYKKKYSAWVKRAGRRYVMSDFKSKTEYLTDGNLALVASKEMVEWAKTEFSGTLEYREFPAQLLDALAKADTLLTNAPLEGTLRDKAVYVFDLGNDQQAVFDKKYLSWLDGNSLYIGDFMNGYKLIKAVDAQGNLVGFLLPIKPGAEITDTKPARLKSFSAKKSAAKPAKTAIEEPVAAQLEEPIQTEETDTAKEATASEKLADMLLEGYINTANIKSDGKALTSKELYALADKAFGGTQAEGAYDRKDAYDAMELAVNQFLLKFAAIKSRFINFNGNAAQAVASEKLLSVLMDKLPTQNVRTQEMEDFQQFSTPPNIAYLAAWAADIRESDFVLEPSAGIGGLAVFAKAWGATVAVNELSKRRLEVLRSMQFDYLFNENAEHIDNILPEEITPSVVIMNPPFSSTAGRTATNKTSNAEKHIDQALARLRDGGRLVAILGKGMNDADYYKYWDKLRKSYSIRANLSIDGTNYKKYGTTYDVQIVVIDKTGPQTGETLTGKYSDLTEIPKILEEIRNDRGNVEEYRLAGGRDGVGMPVSDSGNQQTATGYDGSDTRADRGAADVERAEDREVSARTQRSTARTDRKRAAESSDKTLGSQDGGRDRDAGREDTRDGDGAAGSVDVDRHQSKLSLPQLSDQEAVSDDGVYATFVAPDVPVKGGKKHPAVLVESAAMAAVSMPKATYKVKLPADVVKNNLSDAQLVTVTYAGQAHEQKLPDGKRKGFFIGDGTGVGKGRQIAGIILDNFMQGRDKAVWISKNDDLYGDAVRDWTATTGRSKDEVVSQGKFKPRDTITMKSGILFTSYGKLKMEKGGSRLDQIVNWLGEDFDGVIAFDEAHFMGNLFGKKGKFGKSKGSLTAQAGVELQRRLPNARILYVSATAATEVDNLAYAERIGLWGQGTAFTNAQDFISKIGSSGLAAMELVIRDMKAMGVYVARSISYNGVNYDTVEHALDPMQTEIYNTMSRAWQKTMTNVQSALETTGGKYNSTERQKALGNFYSGMQRFYNQVLTSMSMPSVIADMRRELDAGHSCVLQIVNTNEAQQNKQLAEAKASGESLDNLDLTPREALIGYLMTSFPTQMFEEYTDDDGNLRSRPVMDSAGNPVQNKEAIRQRDALVAEVNQMSIPDGPLEMLFDAFGTEAVAENTGRSRRVVPKKMADGSITRVEESRSLNHRTADVQAFQDGKKRILVFSDAGGTGKSYHADRSEKNQQLRVHYVLQPGWVASNAVQGFGRTHRSNEVSAPVYKLVTTNIKGQKRFTSTIARRLDQLGALTKGQRDTGSGMFGAKDNLETDLARDSLREFYRRLGKGMIEGVDGMKTLERLGLKEKFTDEFGSFKINEVVARDISTFLNRILALEVDEQNTVFDAFISIYEMELEAAIQSGTLDTGMENVKADKIEVVDDKIIRQDETTGAQTHYIQAKTYRKPVVVATVAEMSKRRDGFVGVYKTSNGAVRAVFRIADKTTEWGAVQKQYRLVSPNLGAKTSVWNENTLQDKAEALDKSEWQSAWDQEVAKVPEYNEDTLHMLTGALLPIWNALPQEGNTKVKRLITVDGDAYLGRVIDKDQIDAVLGRFSIDRTKEVFSAKQVMDKAIKDGVRFVLTNNRTELFRSKVSGEWRLEVFQPYNAWYLTKTYPGIIQERIQYRDRYFIPVGEKGVAILEKMLADNPVQRTTDDDEQLQRRDGRMTDQEVLAYAVEMYESDVDAMGGLSAEERSALDLFKQRLAKLDELIEKRYEQGEIYRENTFKQGGDRELAEAAHNRMEVLDGQIARESERLLEVQKKSVLKGVLEKARTVVQREEAERGNERLRRRRERRENAAAIRKYRDRIIADYNDLVSWLTHPMNKDVTKHVNENVKQIVIPFLLSIDMTSKQQLRGGAATKADEKHVKQAEKLLSMLRGLDEETKYSGDYDLPLNFEDRLQRHVETVQKLMDEYGGETVLNKMTAEELKNLSVLTANLKTALTTLNKFHTNAMFAHVSTAGDNTVRYLRKMGDSDGNWAEDFLMWKNIRPAYVWERFGEGGVSIEQALRRGQSKLAWNAKEIIDYAKATFTKEERKDWEEGTVTVSLSGDREIRVTVAALMSFYELSKRAQGRAHILSGGVTVSDVEIRENKKKRRIKGRYGKFTEADIDAMNAALTDHQKEVADKLQQFMEKRGGEWGNHVTLARFGEKAFGEKGYFPISVDKQSLSTNNDKNVKGADLYRLLNMGFTKELSSNTSQPVVLYSIFDVFSTHMADMAQYNAMALPVLDAIRWLNYKHFEFEGDERVEKSNLRAELRRVYGAPVSKGGEVLSGYAESFIAHILQAYNGTEAQGTPGDSLGMQMLHTYNRAQIAFNMRVVVQQPMAITRASMVIDPKYITQALNPKLIKQNVDDMLTHSGIAVWKDLGYYDINISRGLTQMIKQDSTFSEKVTEVGLKPAEFADKATWAVLWGACKLQLKAQGVTDYAEIEKLFDEVIYKTQVVDSVLTKSQYMRDKGFFARSTASFMSEPTTTASMLLGEFDAYRADIRRGLTIRQAWNNHKKTIGKTVLVYSVSAILLSMVTAAADAWLDDDDYQNIAEKWNEAFWQNLLDEISPFNKLPLINNVWELGKVALDTFTNLDVYGNLPDAAWAQWADTLSKAWSITQELIEGESNYTWYAAIYKYLQVASGLSGLPISAGTREVVTVWNNVIGTFAPSLKIKDYELKPMTEIKYAVMDGYLTADEAADELMKQELVYDREEAELTAELWAYIADHKEYSDLSVHAYSLYKENCKGVDMGYFYQAWKYYSQTDADRDKDGEPISGSKKRKVLDFIYQMRLTPAQKKQLIKCFYK